MRNKYVIGYYNLANFVTMTGLACAVIACFMIAGGNYFLAMLCFCLAGLCDAVDGRIARATPSTSKRARFYGVQLDSLCDVVSFGIAPCFMAYQLGYNRTLDIVIYMFFAVCGAIRLANFNTEAAVDSSDMKPKHFTGIPIPFSVVVFPLLMIIHMLVGSPVLWLFRLVFFLVGFGYIIRIRVPKPTGKVQFAVGIYEVICLIAMLIIGAVK